VSEVTYFVSSGMKNLDSVKELHVYGITEDTFRRLLKTYLFALY